MSALEPIDVDPATLSEAVRRDLTRVERVDAADAAKHKAERRQDACPTCRALVRSFRRLADNQLTPLGEQIEKVARKLAEQTWRQTPGEPCTPEQMEEIWGFVLNERVRNEYRHRAEELIALLDVVPSAEHV